MSESEHRLRRGGKKPHLSKQNSWSPDTVRDEAWSNRRRKNLQRRGRSVTDDDVDELRACFELGFNFDSPDLDPKLSSAFPALEFYHAVNRRYSNTLSRSSSLSFSDSDSTSTCIDANISIIDPSKCSISLFNFRSNWFSFIFLGKNCLWFLNWNRWRSRDCENEIETMGASGGVFGAPDFA